MMTRSACSSSAGSVSFSRNPLAPARRARKMYSSSPKLVRITTRTPSSRSSATICRVACEAVEHRHLNVHQGDVRAVLGGQGDRLPPVGGLGDHLDVVFRFEQRPDAAADQRLVVGQQDPDHDGARAGSSAYTWKPPPSRGPAWSRPPSAVTRSRMPMRPSPGPDRPGAGAGAGAGARAVVVDLDREGVR